MSGMFNQLLISALLFLSLALAAPLASSTSEPTRVFTMATPTAPSDLSGRQASTWAPWTPAWTDPAWTTPSPSASHVLTPLQKSTSLEGGVLVAVIIGSLIAFGLLGCVLSCLLRNSSGSCCSRRRKVAQPSVERDGGFEMDNMAARLVRRPEAAVVAVTPRGSEISHDPHVTWTRGVGFV
ncbi:hypothetical protein GMOD_00000093 [Pyrenophora seminiperda CCB06]|uniref:Uncharacterized protein n=1 Tax=Pyrenophora seminiperda CCB06 TaxID=1302712 RepID=A0A3M7M6D5_9PLEO|nr:hypothetical protein GMOD_00000093 [Pyrenophora seminiperda CCB06]